MVAIAGVRRCPPLAAFGLAVALHLLPDACEKGSHRRLRQTLEVRRAGYCEACATRQRSPALMEPLYTGKQNGKDDFDPADPAH
jgi:hypothetical protein